MAANYQTNHRLQNLTLIGRCRHPIETTYLLDRRTYSFALQEQYQVRHTACITGIGKEPISQNAEGVIHMGDAKRGFSGTSVCEVNAP